MRAAEKGHADVIRMLLNNGADINVKAGKGWTALSWAAWGGNSESVKLLRDKTLDVSLTDAACLGDLEVVRRLVSQGSDVNEKTEYNRTPLMGAAKNGRLEIIELLLEKGSDVNAGADHWGKTALMNAAEEGHLKASKMLLDKGADVKTRTHRGTALKIAQQKGHKDIEALLKARGAKE
jgi:ankyrin repeat protein